jgi:hypothetical protein
MIFYEVSAKNNLNVEKAFKELAIKVIARQEEAAKTNSMDAKISGQKLKGNLDRRRSRKTTLSGKDMPDSKKDCKC